QDRLHRDPGPGRAATAAPTRASTRLLCGSHACSGLCIHSLVGMLGVFAKQDQRKAVLLADCGHFIVERLRLNDSCPTPNTCVDALSA
ncbi:hypothetical protein, partial [Acidithiobacillus thiooxidans]|uniref:hypothetical protein n=2 Tax=Acidithiobacillus thiooxidans TaxID=930 RepID=UPI001C313349